MVSCQFFGASLSIVPSELLVLFNTVGSAFASLTRGGACLFVRRRSLAAGIIVSCVLKIAQPIVRGFGLLQICRGSILFHYQPTQVPGPIHFISSQSIFTKLPNPFSIPPADSTMPSSKPVSQAEYGPCLGCFRQLDLVAADREVPCFSFPFLSFRISRNDRASDVNCRHCGFHTDLASYSVMRNQSKVIESCRSVDTDTSTTTSYNDGSVLSGSRHLVGDIDFDETSMSEEYVSLAGLLITEKYYSECCKSCQASLAPNWRFCPNCGLYTEEIMLSFSYSTDESTSQPEECFQHLLIEPRQKQICKTQFGTRNRPVSPDKVGTVLSIFRSNNPDR